MTKHIKFLLLEFHAKTKWSIEFLQPDKLVIRLKPQDGWNGLVVGSVVMNKIILDLNKYQQSLNH